MRKVQLGYTTVRSPVEGRTGLRLVDEGNIVHATDTTGLVVINQIDPIAVVFTLPEDEFHKVNEAIRASGKAPLEVLAFAQGSKTSLGTGRLLLVNNQIDTTTGTFQLKALFPNPAHSLWPGQYVDARLILGTRRAATTVPDSAIQRGPNGLLRLCGQFRRGGRDAAGEGRPDAGRQGGDRGGPGAGRLRSGDGQYKIKPGAKVVATRPGKAAAPESKCGDAR